MKNKKNTGYKNEKKHRYRSILVLLLTALIFNACSDEEQVPDLPIPSATAVEIGLDDNRQGIVGMDFHFNADVLAGDKIEDVRINIRQKDGQTYTSPWEFEIIWVEYRGSRNAGLHKHFDIPEDAPVGVYDFYFIVDDQNGTTLEIREDFTIVSVDNTAAISDASSRLGKK